MDLSSKYSPILSYIASTSPKYVSKCFIFSVLIDMTRRSMLIFHDMMPGICLPITNIYVRPSRYNLVIEILERSILVAAHNDFDGLDI